MMSHLWLLDLFTCWFPSSVELKLLISVDSNRLAKQRQATAWVFWGRATWKDCLSLTLAVIGNIHSHFDSSDRWQFLIKLTICSFWSFTFIFLCFRKWSGNFYRKDNSHHLLLPPLQLTKTKSSSRAASNLNNFARLLSLSVIAPLLILLL